MNYLEIFCDIVSILHEDYSGCLDKKGWDNPLLYQEKIKELQDNEGLTPEIFHQLVNEYLLDFKDGHMFFRLISQGTPKAYDNGFKCRRYEDKLYITYCGKETRLKKGMAITALEGIPVTELVKKHHRQLHLLGEHYEREKWEPVILKYKSCTVEEKNGHTFEIDLNKYEREMPKPEYSLKGLPGNVQLMTLSDFNNGDAINRLIDENKKQLEECRALIIDVRVNGGGSDSSYYKLLDYIFPKETSYKELDDGTVMLINMTERNYRLRMKLFNDFLSNVKDQGTIDFLNSFIREFKKNRNNGFVEIKLWEDDTEAYIKGRSNPKMVVVLSDVYCGSSGDAFVETAVKSEKVTFMGRATAGITDYSNLSIQEYENTFQLCYPTSRISSIDSGKGLSWVGVQPHVHIPWTPEHIDEDVDLKKALELIDESMPLLS
jgi:C-terminal processing protease CtpA/Prc